LLPKGSLSAVSHGFFLPGFMFEPESSPT